MLPGRSDNDIKNRWHSKMRSKAAKRKWSVNDQGGEASGISARYASVNTMHPTKQERKRSKQRAAPVVVTEAVKSNNTHHLAMAPASNNGTTSLPQGHAKSNYEQMYGEYCNTQAPAYHGAYYELSFPSVRCISFNTITHVNINNVFHCAVTVCRYPTKQYNQYTLGE